MIPPWLNINPLSGVDSFLSGVGRGTDLARFRMAADNAAQQAQEHADSLEERKGEFAAQLAQHIEAQKEKAETAARQFEGQSEYTKLIEGGLKPDEALIKAGPKMFYKNPVGFESAIASNAARALQAKHTEELNQFRMLHEQRMRDAAAAKIQADSTAWQMKQDKVLLDEAKAAKKDELKADEKDEAAKKAVSRLALKFIGEKPTIPIEQHVAKAKQVLSATGVNVPEEFGGFPRPEIKEPTGGGHAPVAEKSVKVKRKSDGKMFIYRGSVEEVPTDKYDILE